MIHSALGNIALAHYPKTAGCTMFQWFTSTFPDALHINADRPHMSVRRGLEKLGLAGRRRLRPFSPVDWLAPRRVQAEDHSLRIIGVLREPFEMLVSLYEFWKRTPQGVEVSPFIEAARSGTFRDFLWMAVIQKEIPQYEDFFDAGGPNWANTRLIDFNALESGLAAVCDEFGIWHAPLQLERINDGGGGRRNLAPYRAEAATMTFNVRSHFRWYYEHGVRLMVRGAAELQAAA